MQTRPKSCSNPANATDSVTATDPVVVVEAAEAADTSPTAIVFDIQRSSFQDGPGIRTTVFLKGCPLQCVWCHNPESQRFQPELMVKADLCTACGRCREACPTGAADGPETDRSRCADCGACAAVCPSRARILKGWRASVEEVMRVVRRDIPFYDASGDGLTVSGGEPLSQPGFLRALLESAKSEGIHTCVETCGHASWNVVAPILPFADLFLYDWKLTDPDKHLIWTGRDNRLVRENLERMLEAGARVLVRAPLIPGVNDEGAHLDELIRLSHLPGVQGVEVLPWHRMGLAKRAALGLALQLEDLPDATEEQKARWQAYWSERGGNLRFA